MKRSINSLLFLISIFVLSFSLSSCNQTPDKTNKGETQAQKGAVLYEKYCVACHGEHGDGPEAGNLKEKPFDLTKITSRRKVKNFPVAEIARFIDGRQFKKSHGEREMPIWGEVFVEKENMTQDEVKGKLGDIIGYLMSIQE